MKLGQLNHQVARLRRTRCSTCNTEQGPFVRDADLPGHPVCGIRRGAPPDVRAERIRRCLQRRDALDNRRTAA